MSAPRVEPARHHRPRHGKCKIRSSQSDPSEPPYPAGYLFLMGVLWGFVAVPKSSRQEHFFKIKERGLITGFDAG